MESTVTTEREPEKQVMPAHIDAMLRREFYPHRPAGIEFRQTHISWVFLADNFVFKLKKPVRFSFLDSSTLAARFNLCRQELRLNRRISPDVYLGVFPILRTAGGYALGEETERFDQNAVDYAVKMTRLPEDRMLDAMVTRGQVGPAEIRRLAARIAAFHAADSFSRAWTYGSAAAVWRKITRNLGELQAFVGSTTSPDQLNSIEAYFHDYVMAHWELLNERAQKGRVIEGHGDLRCEHICMTDRIEIFDCLEFDERLRYCDAASEIGFLAMDLERLNAPELADELVSAYSEAAGDPVLPRLVTFYKCHRALIRAKVESLRSTAPEVPEGEREQARALARRYFAMAERYVRHATPALILVCGLSGTGKSTIAATIARRTGFEVIGSDRTRKRLFKMPETHRVEADYGGGIYASEFGRITYDTMLEKAEKALSEGRGVIVDATFKDREDRARFIDMASRRGVPGLFIECRADEAEIVRRLKDRAAEGRDVSDATPEVFVKQREEFAPLDEVCDRFHLVIDTGGPLEQMVRTCERFLDSICSAIHSENVTRGRVFTK